MIWEFILRIFVAGVLGGMIGFEREFRSKEAGLRTHFLVALGSALFMIISAWGFEGMEAGRYDVSRVAAQVVTGIGFLGAGIIIFQRGTVRGLTTAAGLWVTAAIGMACGGGMYVLAVVATVLVLIILEVLHYMLPQFGEKSVVVTFTAASRDALVSAVESFKARKMSVSSYSISVAGPNLFKAAVTIRVRHDNYVAALAKLLDETPGITLVSIE